MNKGPPPARLCPYAFQGCNLPEGCALSREAILAAVPLDMSDGRPVGGQYTTHYAFDRRKRVNAAAKKCKYHGPAVDPRVYHTRRTRPQPPARMIP